MPAMDSLQRRIGEGIMAFPATPFRDDLSLDQTRLEEHIARLASHKPTALVAAGGAGEIFSLSLAEHELVIRVTVANAGDVPVIGGAAYGTAIAREMAQAVERAGAAAVLLLPPYLVNSEQEGLFRHIKAVAESVSIAVIPYSRDNAILAPQTMVQLAESCPNVIALKDGTGNIEAMAALKHLAGDRLTIVNGAPTAEVFAPQFKSLGVLSYSSAVFTFLPSLARTFFGALHSGDIALTERLLQDFYRPLVELRRRRHGYSVSIVKAGLRVCHQAAGPVRPPLTDLQVDEEEVLSDLVAKVLQWTP
jgi:5-dehydro-4-deoxyglucarate dehydratase